MGFEPEPAGRPRSTLRCDWQGSNPAKPVRSLWALHWRGGRWLSSWTNHPFGRGTVEIGRLQYPVLLGDKGYDDQNVRALAREDDVRPVIKHREFSPLHKAWNARLDADLYGSRSQSETVYSTLKRKYGVFVRSRRWWKQFR